MNVLILGNGHDVHAVRVKAALEEKGCQVEYFETTQFPTQVHLTWQPDAQEGRLVLSDSVRWHFSEIRSVYWRTFSGIGVTPMDDFYQRNLALNDATSAIRTFLQIPSIHWVNSWRAYQFHKEKPLQLSQAKQLGVKIPKTLITNDPQEILEFSQSEEKLIFKPVYGGAHAGFLTAEHLEQQRLQSVLRMSPITIQEYIPGTNVRTYVIGQSIYAVEICAQSVDFRDDLQAKLIPLEVPEKVQQQCRAIAEAFWLEWTAIDWRLTPDGEYVFLEANPSPMFIHVEQQTGLPITEDLVKLLMQ